MGQLTGLSRLLCWCVLALMTSPALAGTALAADRADMLGGRGPLFSVATSQDALAVYVRDYYGKHHLVLTFIPAAFTPI